MRKVVYLFIFLGAIAFAGAQDLPKDLNKYLKKYGVSGSVSIYSLNENKYYLSNPKHFKKPLLPASTFKIVNSLVALESGVINDENSVIKWDGKRYFRDEWNQDLDMKTAFKYSAVWYYQEVALRIGAESMKYWLDKINYGNADTSGGLDEFWLRGGLRITPEGQISFLRKLYANNLEFSQRSMDIVKKMMINESTDSYVLRGKTGWATEKNQIGWFVGWLETKHDIYFFAVCIDQKSETPNFVKSRTQIIKDIFTEAKIIE